MKVSSQITSKLQKNMPRNSTKTISKWQWNTYSKSVKKWVFFIAKVEKGYVFVITHLPPTVRADDAETDAKIREYLAQEKLPVITDDLDPKGLIEIEEMQKMAFMKLLEQQDDELSTIRENQLRAEVKSISYNMFQETTWKLVCSEN